MLLSSFFLSESNANRRSRIRLKKRSICFDLCYPVKEALKVSPPGMGSGNMPVRSYGDKISSNNGFQIRWRDVSQIECSAHMNGDREISFVSVLSPFSPNGHVRGDHFGKVVHDQVCKDLLEAVRHLFCVESCHTDGIFQGPERRLDPPAQSIKFFQFFSRKEFSPKIRQDSFIFIFRQGESYDPERKCVEASSVVMITFLRKIIKRCVGRKEPVVIPVF